MNPRRMAVVVVVAVLAAAAGAVAWWRLTAWPAPATDAVLPNVYCFGVVDLEDGCTPLAPLRPGRVVRVLVRENEPVSAGGPILELESGAAEAAVEEAKAAAAAAETKLALSRKAPDRHEVRAAEARAAVNAAWHALAAARHQLARKQYLASHDLASADDGAAAAEEVRRLEALYFAEGRKRAEVELEEPGLEIQGAEQEAAAATARLHQAEEALDQCTLRAPRAGIVLRVLVTPGEVVNGSLQQPAVIFAVDEPRVVRAEVEQEFAGRLKVGQTVRVQDDADDRTFSTGRVTRLSEWYLQRRSVFLEPNRYNDARTLECIVSLDPQDAAALRIGQRVRVSAQP